MLSIEGSTREPQLWVGASLKHFGLTPYAKPLFRVVLKSTRVQLYGGRYIERQGAIATDREVRQNNGRDNSIRRERVGYRWQPMYAGADGYVLEKWLSGFEFTGMTPAQWERDYRDPQTGLLTLGPYPAEGEYFRCYDFPPGYPTSSAVEAVINLVRAGERYSFQEKRQALLKAQERESLSKRNRAVDLILDAQPAHGINVAVSGSPGRRKAEDMPEKYSVRDLARLGLKPGANKVFTTPQKRG